MCTKSLYSEVMFRGSINTPRSPQIGNTNCEKAISVFLIGGFASPESEDKYVFSEFMFPLLNQTLSSDICLGSIDSVGVFSSSLHPSDKQD